LDANAQIHCVSEDNFEAVVAHENMPVLLLCMPRDDHFALQIKVVTEAVVKYVGPLKIGLLDESFIGPFRKRYGVPGTPTFLILHKGREKGRLLGLADEQMLGAFIADACLAPPGGSQEEYKYSNIKEKEKNDGKERR